MMLRVNLRVVEKIHPQNNKFVAGVKIKSTGDSNLYENPGYLLFSNQIITFSNRSLIVYFAVVVQIQF